MRIIVPRKRPSMLLLLLCVLYLIAANLSGCGAARVDSSAQASKRVTSVIIAPADPHIALGKDQQFSATALFNDGSKTDVTHLAAWSSAQSKIATVGGGGLASSQAVGSTSIVALYQAVSASSTLTVNPAALVSITVAPQGVSLTPNHSVQLSATGTFSNGSTEDLTSAVLWLSSPTGIVAIGPGGMLTAQALGTATVSATSNALSAPDTVTVVAPTLQSISITSGKDSIPSGESLQLSATGQYNDGSTQDLTTSVQWASSNPTILSLSSSGVVTAKAIGSATVTGAAGTIKGATPLTVGPPVAVSFKIAPADSLLAAGGHEQLSAFETLSDGTTQHVTGAGSWSSSNSSVADVTNEGFVVARHAGTTTISLSSGSAEGSANLTVKPVLAVSYFSHANTSGFADSNLRLSNPGVTGGNLCAEIYVFDQDQQLSECCGCLLSPDGLLTLSVNSDLTGNPLTGVKSTTGVIEIVSAGVPANLSCDPSAITANGELLAWSTNVQAKSASAAVAFTENSFQLSPLGDADLAALESQCSMVATLGSGHGVCGCGAGASNGIANARHHLP
jgi:Bacterial Ig-like domain (group 2)